MRKSKHKQISRRSLSVVRGSSRESSAVGNWEEGAGKMASGRRRRVAWVSTIFAEGAVFARDKKAKRGKRRREANKQEREGERMKRKRRSGRVNIRCLFRPRSATGCGNETKKKINKATETTPGMFSGKAVRGKHACDEYNEFREVTRVFCFK